MTGASAAAAGVRVKPRRKNSQFNIVKNLDFYYGDRILSSVVYRRVQSP
jgi:hypothetical protein